MNINIHNVIYTILFIIPSLVGGLLWSMFIGEFFKNKEIWKFELYTSISAIIISGIIFPCFIFIGIYEVNFKDISIICIVYTIISIKIFYSNDWKKYKRT